MIDSDAFLQGVQIDECIYYLFAFVKDIFLRIHSGGAVLRMSEAKWKKALAIVVLLMYFHCNTINSFPSFIFGFDVYARDTREVEKNVGRIFGMMGNVH